MNTGMLLAHLSFTLLVFLLLPTRRLSLRGRLAVLAAAGGLSFLTLEGLSLGDYTRSYTNDLAITTLLWLSWCVFSRLRGLRSLSSRHQLQLALCFAAMALLLYPATLGLSQLDPYRLGFSPAPLLVSMALLCVWLWWQHNHLALGLITLATGAYLLEIKDADNYWNYLIDPILGIYCCAYLLCRAWRAARPAASAVVTNH